MRKTLLLILAVILTACASGSKLNIANLEKLNTEKRLAVDNMPILNQLHLENRKFKILNLVEGHSCQVLTGDPPVTRTGAIQQLKYFAHEMSGDGITNIKCAKEGTSLATNCWELISCTAEVIKFNE